MIDSVGAIFNASIASRKFVGCGCEYFGANNYVVDSDAAIPSSPPKLLVSRTLRTTTRWVCCVSLHTLPLDRHYKDPCQGTLLCLILGSTCAPYAWDKWVQLTLCPPDFAVQLLAYHLQNLCGELHSSCYGLMLDGHGKNPAGEHCYASSCKARRFR